MSWSKATEKVGDTVGKISDNRVERKKIADAGNEAQRELNKMDAQDGGFFRSGWRPTLCWFVTILFIWNHGLGDMFSQAVEWFEFKPLGDDTADNLVWVLLGLGGVRTAEKTKKWWGRK